MGFICKNEKLERFDFGFFLPTQVKFGKGKVANLATELQIENDLAEKSTAMLITDRGVAAAGLVDKVLAGITSTATIKAAVVYDSVPSDSDTALVEELASQVQANGIDLIIAVGGGSVIDTAKFVSVLGIYGGKAKDYEGGFMVPGPCIPVIAIPTTVGTGSEVTFIAVAKDKESGLKLPIASPYLYPRMAVLDPEMVVSLPAKLVAQTGMDALTHAIEAYVSTESQPFSDALALKATEMIYDNILAATQHDSDALAKMQIAATMAGIAFTNAPVGATHAISHTVGALYNIHHGLANAIALPYVMEFNLEACPSRYASLARAMGIEERLSDIEIGLRGIELVKELRRKLCIPERFREVGVPTDADTIDKICKLALEDVSMAFNPRKAEMADFRPLIEKSI
ncbi:MAG: iron-containing alcohol dehydrogenase [Acidobacteriota bacterium]|nr:iron-containing alcohol dehydrogenase [Blastocatellia bacterium]MDW8411235.1 iron-containing alcohol dehydrogenase [Acidobacteriota bacterium]